MSDINTDKNATPNATGRKLLDIPNEETQRVILDQLNKMQNDIINLKLSIDQLIMINKHIIRNQQREPT